MSPVDISTSSSVEKISASLSFLAAVKRSRSRSPSPLVETNEEQQGAGPPATRAGPPPQPVGPRPGKTTAGQEPCADIVEKLLSQNSSARPSPSSPVSHHQSLVRTPSLQKPPSPAGPSPVSSTNPFSPVQLLPRQSSSSPLLPAAPSKREAAPSKTVHFQFADTNAEQDHSSASPTPVDVEGSLSSNTSSHPGHVTTGHEDRVGRGGGASSTVGEVNCASLLDDIVAASRKLKQDTHLLKSAQQDLAQKDIDELLRGPATTTTTAILSGGGGGGTTTALSAGRGTGVPPGDAGGCSPPPAHVKTSPQHDAKTSSPQRSNLLDPKFRAACTQLQRENKCLLQDIMKELHQSATLFSCAPKKTSSRTDKTPVDTFKAMLHNK